MVFHPRTTVIFGLNGAGKTNILEALCLVAAGYSPRTRLPVDIPRHGEETMRLTAEINTGSAASIAATTTVTDRRLSHRVVPETLVPSTFFSPDDLSLVKGGPAHRRRYLDEILFQISPPYRHHWRRYRTALSQRNAVLKAVRSRRAQSNDLSPWTDQLVASGARLTAERASLCTRLHSRVTAFSDDMVSSPTDTALAYLPSCSPTHHQRDWQADAPVTHWQSQLDGAVAQALPEDISFGLTTIGPHRDDVLLLIAGRPARDFASQGQQRTLSLALRIAQLTEGEAVAGESGIILLDDVASELDPDRRSRLPSLIANRQAVITVTEPGLIPNADLLLSVKMGKVTIS